MNTIYIGIKVEPVGKVMSSFGILKEFQAWDCHHFDVDGLDP